jgi:hypothetical protein
MDFVVEFDHTPDVCPHSNAMAGKQFERVPEINLMAKKLGIEVIFAGIAVPEHKRRIFSRSGVYSFKAALCKQTMSGYV